MTYVAFANTIQIFVQDKINANCSTQIHLWVYLCYIGYSIYPLRVWAFSKVEVDERYRCSRRVENSALWRVNREEPFCWSFQFSGANPHSFSLLPYSCFIDLDQTRPANLYLVRFKHTEVSGIIYHRWRYPKHLKYSSLTCSTGCSHLSASAISEFNRFLKRKWKLDPFTGTLKSKLKATVLWRGDVSGRHKHCYKHTPVREDTKSWAGLMILHFVLWVMAQPSKQPLSPVAGAGNLLLSVAQHQDILKHLCASRFPLQILILLLTFSCYL